MERDPFTTLALVTVSFAFASMAIAGKVALAHMPALTLAGLRVALAAAILFPYVRFTRREKVARADLPRLAGLAFLGVTVNQVLFIAGLSLTSAIAATVLVATIPSFTLVAAAALGRERLTRLKTVGVAVSFSGVVVLLGTSVLAGLGKSLLGDTLVVVNALSYSFYLVLARPMLARYRPLTVVAWTFLFGAGFTLVVALPSIAALEPAAIPREAWAALAWVVLVSTVAAYALNNWALKRVAASTVASFVYLQPLIAAVLAVLVLGETPTWSLLVGGALVLVGVAFVTRVREGPSPAGLPAAAE